TDSLRSGGERAVGDEGFERECLDYIAELRRSGVTIVFVSHALDAVRGLCKRTIWLDHGRVMADGPSGEVVDRYLTYENERHAERLKAEQLLPPRRPLTRSGALTAPQANAELDEGEDIRDIGSN